MFELVDSSTPVSRIATGYTFTEGPVWDRRNGRLIFSDIRNQSMYEWRPGGEATLFRRPTGGANGNTFDAEGRLITCEMIARRLVRTEHDGSITELASAYDGKQLNGINDCVCGPDGSIYFSDTPYGHDRQDDGSIVGQGVPFWGVYRLAPDGILSLLDNTFDPPNGVAVSSDGRRLYVNDTAHHEVRVFEIARDGSLEDGRRFCDVRHDGTTGRPDGMKLDMLGNLYLAANTEEGIWVFNPEGEFAGFIAVPEPPANLAWGDDDWQTLYVTARTSVYRVRMSVAGQPVGI